MKIIKYFILLFLVSCGISKHKLKNKDLTEAAENIKTIEQETYKKKTDLKKTVSDSTVSNSNYNIDRSEASVLQNFSLKNNGKCRDPGATRFIQFSDALGNKTTIPVNDNTDLDFKNETDLKKEIEAVKTESIAIKKHNEKLLETNEYLSKRVADLSAKIKLKSTKSDTTTKKNSFSAFALTAVLAVVLWEIIKKLIKKYLFI